LNDRDKRNRAICIEWLAALAAAKVGLGSMLSKKSLFSRSFVATVGAIGFDLMRPGR